MVRNESSGKVDVIKKYGWGVRHIQAVLILTSFTVAYFIRTSMSVAVIAMTDTSHAGDIMIFDWPKKIQGYLLSSFYIGYMIMQIPGGQLAHYYGGKRMISIALIINGAISFILPTLATMGGWKAVSACRVMQGLTQGYMIPSIHTLIGKWAPLDERNRFGNFVYSGYNWGTISAMMFSGKLASTRFGWPMIFYAGGILAMLMGCILVWLGVESPSIHPTITLEEKMYIETSLQKNGKTKKARKTPYKAMLTSAPLGALLIAHIGAFWGSMLMLMETPSFLKMALGINVENSSILTALPYTCALVCTYTSSMLADMAINRKIFSLTAVRKIANTTGTWGAAAALVGLTFIPPGQVTFAVICVLLIVSLDSINCMGFMLNHIDLSPSYAGMLISFTNCFAAGLANLGPITAGFILTDPTDITQWRIVFFIAAGVYFFSNLVFLIFGSGERQYWDSEDDSENKDIDSKAADVPLMGTTKENA